jgi:hypothetical protein
MATSTPAGEPAETNLPPRRIFDYDRSRLPNPHLAALDDVRGMGRAMKRTGLSVGYPAWNLLYYTLLCGLPPERAEPVVIETGTNYGASTIVMAQALEDRGGTSILETVEVEEGAADEARSNVEAAGLSDRVRFHVGDSLAFLEELVGRVDQIDFIFLDDGHGRDHVVAELEIVVPKIAPRGKIYFDNTERGGVAAGLDELRRVYGGSLVEFPNCSWDPPGNAIWQPG